ncbi:MAG: formate C-acetyltransferase/glycerol dehydratase family glycyl radical enzyme [Dehalococcoidales bacterium]|nr:formate C-acetyltransferase/glycerol dehydratase family glycyl radical enzyme [Dehalococcoidales bacterium]
MSSKIGLINAKSRIEKLRSEVVRRMPELCLERAYYFTESYKETESEPSVIRRAKALYKILANMTINIRDGELIVGKATSKLVAGPLFPEVQWEWYFEEFDMLAQRKTERFQPWTEEERAKAKEILSYWKGKSIYDRLRAVVPEEYQRFLGKICLPSSSSPIMHVAHCCPGYERVLTKGLIGIKEQIQVELRKLDLAETKDFDKAVFLKAIGITLDAVSIFAKRYSDLATHLANKETNPQRKKELERIAEVCAWVPDNPARSFHEAMQALWFTYIAVMIEGWGPGVGFGRVDQYLYPFYKKDIDEGRITRDEAMEIISLFYIALNELITPFNTKDQTPGTGQIPLSGITIGGITTEGADAVNDLSFLFLEAEEDVTLQEDVIARIHKNTSEKFLVKVCEIARLVKGKIKFVSDETIINQLLNDGKPIEYARDYGVTGCFIRTVPGRSHDVPSGDFLNLPLMVELALNNGISRLTGEQMGLSTGDPRKFESYDELWDAYKKQVEALVRNRIVPTKISRKLYAEYLPYPLLSALFDGCIEKGVDVISGGTGQYSTLASWACGIPSVGDSLAAVKKVVFDNKKVTMTRLITALDNNFENDAELLFLLKNAPKFGNDDDYVDLIVNDVIIHLRSELAKYRNFAGLKYTIAAGAVTSYIPLGKAVGALPDGRKAGEPLSEGGISPYQGRNTSGPTSTIRSVNKLDLVKTSGGAVLNMRFSPDGLKDESKIKKFAALIRTFCETGGDLIQFNIVSSDTLKDAQKHPENYKDLLVRVATYSAYFIDLPEEVQNDIIARTEFQDL